MISIIKNNKKILAMLVGAFFLFSSSCTHIVTEPDSHSGYRIVPGMGLLNCKIGDDEKTFKNLFSGTTANGYVISRTNGVEALVIDGKIVTLFFFFSKNLGIFDGRTLEGIGKNSTPDDVIQTYGKPDVDVTGSGPFASSTSLYTYHERSIKYPSKGISFTFWDGHLADIRVYKSSRVR